MSYSTSDNFVLINNNISQFDNGTDNLSLKIIDENLFNRNIYNQESEDDAFILNNEFNEENIGKYFQYLLNEDNIKETISDNFKEKMFFYYYDKNVISNNLKLLDDNKLIYSDIDISYYINTKYLNYIILYEYLSQYYKNLATLIQNHNVIDNQTFYNYEFSFDMKHFYHTTLGYINVNIFNKLNLPNMIVGIDSSADFKIKSYNIKFKIGDYNNYYNYGEFINIENNINIHSLTCELDTDDTITPEMKTKVCDYLKTNFIQYIHDKFIKKNSKELLNIEDINNTYYYYVGLCFNFKFKKNLLNYIVLITIYYYFRFYYPSKLAEISDVINNDFYILFKNIHDYLIESYNLIITTEKKIFEKNEKISNKEINLINEIEQLEIQQNGGDDSENLKETISQKKKQLNELKKSNLMSADQLQVKKAIKDKNTLYNINKNIEQTDEDISNINYQKKIQFEYLDKVDIISYFIYFFIIITIFVFSINIAINNSINISIPIVFIIVSIILYIIFNYIIKKSYHNDFNNINNNNSIFHSLYYSIFRKKEFFYNVLTLDYINNNVAIQALFDKYDHDTKQFLKNIINSLIISNTIDNDDIKTTVVTTTKIQEYSKSLLSIIYNNQEDDAIKSIDLLNKKIKLINPADYKFLDTANNDLLITQNNENNSYTKIFKDNWYQYHNDHIVSDDNQNSFSTDIKIISTDKSDNKYEYIILPYNESHNANTDTENFTEYTLNIPNIFNTYNSSLTYSLGGTCPSATEEALVSSTNGISFEILLVGGGESGDDLSENIDGLIGGGAGGAGGGVKNITEIFTAGEYIIKVGGGGKIKKDKTSIKAHDTTITKLDGTVITSKAAEKITLEAEASNDKNKYYKNNIPDATYLNFTLPNHIYSDGGYNNSLIPKLSDTTDSTSTVSFYSKSLTDYTVGGDTVFDDIKKKKINGTDGYTFIAGNNFCYDKLDIRTDNSNISTNTFAAGGGGGGSCDTDNPDIYYSSPVSESVSSSGYPIIRYYKCSSFEKFPGIGGSHFGTPSISDYYEFGVKDSKTFGGRGSNGIMVGKARSAVNNSGSGGGGGTYDSGGNIQSGGNGSGGIVIMRYNKTNIVNFGTCKEADNIKNIKENLVELISNIAIIKINDQKDEITGMSDEYGTLKNTYDENNARIQELDGIITNTDNEREGVLRSITADRDEISSLQGLINSLDTSISNYNSDIEVLMTDKEQNLRDYNELVGNLEEQRNLNLEEQRRKQALILEQQGILERIVELEESRAALETKKSNLSTCTSNANLVRMALTAQEASASGDYTAKLRELNVNLKNQREDAIRLSLEEEQKRNRIYAEQLQVQTDYEAAMAQLNSQYTLTDHNVPRIITLKLDIDYRRAGIFTSDLDSSDYNLQDVALESTGKRDVKEIINNYIVDKNYDFIKEKKKREDFVKKIKFELTSALEIDHLQYEARFNILRIYPGKMVSKPSGSQIISEGTWKDSNYEVSPQDRIEEFALFEIKEHFYDYDTMDENALLRQARTKSYISPNNLTIIVIQIMPSLRDSGSGRDKNTKEIIDTLTSPECITDTSSKLRNTSKNYLRYIREYKIDNGDWIHTEIASAVYSDIDLLKSNYDHISEILTKLNYIMNSDLDISNYNYYDKINPYVKKELKKYNNIDNKIKLYNRIADNTKDINVYDIRYKELLLDFIILISFILSIFLLISKFINYNFILYTILLIIIICLVFIYSVHYLKIVNTKPQNNYWNTFK